MQTSRLLRVTGVGLVLVVLTAGPFFQGLFFWSELLAAIVAISGGFLLWLLGRRKGGLAAGLPGGWVGIALLALLACYLLQFAGALYPRGNLDWVLRVAAGWMVYVMLRAEAGPVLRRWLGWLLVLSASAVAVVGFLEYSGYLMANPALAEALSVVGLQSRMFTVFQYPNTAAAFFLAAAFATVGLALDAPDHRAGEAPSSRPGLDLGIHLGIHTVAGGILALLGMAFFFTISRGALVMLPFGLLLFWLGLDRRRLWPALLFLGLVLVPVVATMRGIGDAVAVRDWAAAFRWIGVGTALGLAGGLALGLIRRLRFRAQLALVVAAVVVAALGLGAIRPVDGFLPKQAARLLDINFRTVNVVLRLVFDRDGLRLVAADPLGLGGWGWDRGYHTVQQFDYVARETHNHYIQTAIEAGVPGAVALLAALGGAAWFAWKARRQGPLAWSLAAGAGLIAGHSAIDFNLSFGLVWLLLWSLLAAAGPPADAKEESRAAFGVGAGSALLTAALAGVLLIGSIQMDRANRLLEAGRAEEAREAARQAARFDPLDSRPLLVLGDQASLERAARLDRNNYRPHFELAILLERQRDYPGAIEAALAARDAYPMAALLWEKAASLTGSLMVDGLHNGRLDEARSLADDLVAMGDEFLERSRGVEPYREIARARPLEMGSAFRLRYGQALYLAGRLDEAERYLTEASQVGLLGSEGEVWLYALYERKGDDDALAALEEKPWIRFRGSNPVYPVIRDWE